ncbi:hypothetical protein BDZ89DRAFT_1168430 [Hymenopellis radicata]|nr:hypothetical protein BDZ89DRAFT_1168430 [Hymenopellis radicata]
MFPFNSAEKADLVVRSSDGVHFFVAKFFLTYNSEFFANLLKDSVPSKRTKLCYPCHIVGEDPVDVDFNDVVAWQAIRDALRKYIMEDAETLFMAYVKSGASRMMKTDPQKCFVLARRAGLDDVARAAAKETSRHPFHDREVFEELALVSALEYRRLLDYFRSCGNAVSRNFRL